MADLQRRVIIFSLFTFCFTFFQGLGFKIFFFWDKGFKWLLDIA